MYTISKEDGTLQKDGQMCYCIYTETSCTSACAAFEERPKDRVFLCCMSREIIAKPSVVKEVVLPPVVKEMEDPLGLGTPKTIGKKMTASKARRTK